jgi:hypothetical protein
MRGKSFLSNRAGVFFEKKTAWDCPAVRLGGCSACAAGMDGRLAKGLAEVLQGFQ